MSSRPVQPTLTCRQILKEWFYYNTRPEKNNTTTILDLTKTVRPGHIHPYQAYQNLYHASKLKDEVDIAYKKYLVDFAARAKAKASSPTSVSKDGANQDDPSNDGASGGNGDESGAGAQEDEDVSGESGGEGDEQKRKGKGKKKKTLFQFSNDFAKAELAKESPEVKAEVEEYVSMYKDGQIQSVKEYRALKSGDLELVDQFRRDKLKKLYR